MPGSTVSKGSNHDASLLHAAVHLLDGVDEAGISEREVALDGNVPVFAAGGSHDLLETRVDNVDLVSAFELINLILEAHELEQASL